MRNFIYIFTVLFLSTNQIPVFAYDFKNEDNLRNICTDLSSGETDFKKYIGDKISFYFVAYSEGKDGAVMARDLKFSSKEWGSCGIKVLILTPSYLLVDTGSFPFGYRQAEGVVKKIDVPKKIVTVDNSIIFRPATAQEEAARVDEIIRRNTQN